MSTQARPGPTNGNTRLTAENVRWIRWVYREKAALPTVERMAAILGISNAQVRRVGQGKQWRDLT